MVEIKKLTYPQYRYEINSSLKRLSNYKMQQEKWFVNPSNSPCVYWGNLLFYSFDVLYNDCDLDEYKESNIGKFFYNEQEAKEIWKFCKWFFELIQKIGECKANPAYLEHPKWPKVYSGARECYMLMDMNDRKYNFSECYQEYYDSDKDEWMKQFKKK